VILHSHFHHVHTPAFAALRYAHGYRVLYPPRGYFGCRVRGSAFACALRCVAYRLLPDLIALRIRCGLPLPAARFSLPHRRIPSPDQLLPHTTLLGIAARVCRRFPVAIARVRLPPLHCVGYAIFVCVLCIGFVFTRSRLPYTPRTRTRTRLRILHCCTAFLRLRVADFTFVYAHRAAFAFAAWCRCVWLRTVVAFAGCYAV